MTDPDRIRAELRAAKTEREWRRVQMEEDLDRSFKSEDGKRVIKEAIKEWVNEQFASFGRWSFYGLCAAALGGLVYFVLLSQGWRK